MHSQVITLFDLGVKVTQIVAQYPLQHVTYAATKFEVATSNGLGGDTFTRNMTHRRTCRHTDGRRTNLGTKLIYPKGGITKLKCAKSLFSLASDYFFPVQLTIIGN